MPKWIRRIIFWIFVTSFFIIAPLLVLYTAGFRYSLSNGTITRTGVLSITTSPRNADIYLNGEYTQENTPKVLKHIIPGDYTLELSKDGYHSWFSDIKIESGQTTQLQNTILFLDESPTLLFDKKTEILEVNPNGESIAYLIREGGWQEIWLYYPNENNHKLISQTIDEKNNIEISWSARGSFLQIFDNTNKILSLYKEQGDSINIDILNITNTKWHPSTDHLISLTTKSKLIQLDVTTGSTEISELTNETSVLLDASILKLIQGDEYTEIAQYINGEKETLALLPKAKYTIKERDDRFLIIINSINQLYLLQIHEDEPILLKEEITGYDWDVELNRLAFTNGFELSIYDAETHITELITRQSSTIKSIHWHPTENIIFVYDSELHAFEIFTQAENKNITTLLSNADIETSWISNDGKILFFYGEYDNVRGVYQLKLSANSTF